MPSEIPIQTQAPRPEHRRGRRAAWIVAALVAAIGLAVGWQFDWFRPKPADTAAADGNPDGASAEMDPGKVDTPDAVKLTPEVVQKYGVRIGIAKKRKLASSIVAPARVAFDGEAMAVIGTPVQGRIIEIKVRAGDAVTRDEPLLVIESTELGEAQSDFMQKRTAVTTAAAGIEPARKIYEQYKQLYDERQLISLTEVRRREIELRQAEGALATAESARAAAENRLRLLGVNGPAIDDLVKSGEVNPRYIVRSPLAGEVIERNVNLGELVKPEREKLLVLADTSTLWVWADVPEARAREVAVGAAACISLTAAGDCSFGGKVSHIAAGIDETTRSLRVRIDVKNQPGLRPGMFAQVEISGKSDEHAEPVLAVPEAAIQSVNGGPAVFVRVKDEPNTFQLKKVTTGDYVNGMAAITAGLTDGEPVVTAGSAILKADLLKSTAKDDD